MHNILSKLELNTKNSDFYKHKLITLAYEVTEFKKKNTIEREQLKLV